MIQFKESKATMYSNIIKLLAFALITATTSGGCRDNDGDGYPVEEDCNDNDSTAWSWTQHTGEVIEDTSYGVSNEGDFCAGYCSLSINGSVSVFGEFSVVPIDGGPTSESLDLWGMWCVQNISGDLYVAANYQLRSLHGLERLQTIGGLLGVSENSDLLYLENLQDIKAIGSLRIINNKAIKTAAFNPIESTQLSELVIGYNATLKVLPSFVNPQVVLGDFYISKNKKLQDLKGLRLESVSGDFQITNNKSLTDISALYGLEYIGGNLKISGNPSLPTSEIDDFVESIDEIVGSITIENNLDD